MFTIKKCTAVTFTLLFLASSTLALADDEEARSEEVRVETSEEVLSVEPAASPEAMAFVQATTLPDDDEWHFIAAPYLWVVDTGGTIKIGPIVQEIDLPFSAILSQLQGAFILHFEATKKRWGAATDFSYVSAAKGGALQIPLPGGSTASGGRRNQAAVLGSVALLSARGGCKRLRHHRWHSLLPHHDGNRL